MERAELKRRSGSGRGLAPWPGRAEPAAEVRRRANYSAAERKRLLSSWKASGLTARDFGAREGMKSSSVLFAWQHAAKQAREQRKAGGSRNPQGKTRRPYPDAERVAAVSAYRSSGLTQRAFARVWGVSLKSLSSWLSRVARHGDSGLKSRKTGRPAGGGGKRALSAAAAAQVVATAQAHPSFGLRKLTQYVQRFCGVKVARATVKRTLARAGVARLPQPARKVKRGPPAVRFFERASPNQLWQTDITSLWLASAQRHVYLTVFLDDHSRYVVGWKLEAHLKSSLVLECLKAALAAFGRPQEILTDQGPQYTSWRGKSQLQRLLKREGIAHVVAASHHPQTLGKCERLWRTVKEELWERIEPRDLEEARERLGHFLSHYNHGRPHQGMDGAIPADRYFGLASEVRAVIEARHADNELLMALGQSPRKPVFLLGQIDGQAVSLHGERGRLVINTPQGGRQEVKLEDLGGLVAGRPQPEDGSDGARVERSDGERGAAAAEREAGVREPLAEAGLAGAGSVGVGDGGAAAEGAPGVHGDPGAVAGEEDGGAGGERAGSGRGAGLAIEPVGSLGDAGGAAEATTLAREDRDGGYGGRARGAAALAEGGEGASGEDPGGGGADRALARDAGESHADQADDASGDATGDGRGRQAERGEKAGAASAPAGSCGSP